jgi:outer membrane protein assembly factor BamB
VTKPHTSPATYSRGRLGWLGPAIVIVGALVAGVGVVYWMHARPEPGDPIASYAVPELVGDGATLVIRHERGSDEREFVELHASQPDDHVVWQALIPHYAGNAQRPALAWSHDALTIRIERGGRAEVFALSMHDGDKLGGFRLAVEHEPVVTQPTGPITLTDHVRAYEIVGGATWHQLIGVDLATGEGIWKVDLGAEPITDGGVEQGNVWLDQGGRRKTFDGVSGRDEAVTSASK